MRRLVTLSSLVALMMFATSAHGGGAVWEFEGYHRPGDIVESTTAVAWNHNSDLGTPEDGPYLLYLAPGDVDSHSWPQVPEESLLVGIVEVREGPFAGDGGDLYGPHHAIARFEIPDVVTGSYQIFHCNDPCTTTLGDIVGGWDLRVIGGPGGRQAEEIADEVRSRIAATPLLVAAESPPATEAAVEAPVGTSRAESSTPGEETPPEPAPDERTGTLAGRGAVDSDRSPTHDQTAMAEQTLRPHGLWLSTAGVIALLLVVRMVRIEARWHRGPALGAEGRNETPSRDVLTDE